MNFKGIIRPALVVLCMVMPAMVLHSCRVKYSFTGASIHKDAKTFSVAYFPNNAAFGAPTLSSTLTEDLKDRFSRQTRLVEVTDEPGDLALEGEIIDYTTTPSAVSGSEQAVENRLTIRVRVRFNNRLEPQYNFDKTFQQFSTYPVSQSLQEAETSLIPEIVEMLVDDIFNAAVSNW